MNDRPQRIHRPRLPGRTYQPESDLPMQICYGILLATFQALGIVSIGNSPAVWISAVGLHPPSRKSKRIYYRTPLDKLLQLAITILYSFTFQKKKPWISI